MELGGVEPPTSRMPCVRSSQLSYSPPKEPNFIINGLDRTRTGNLHYAKVALYQLSYEPKKNAT